ncbi:MAG TPA: hypothetical protein VE397_09285 [Stellaceae bacterium]|jgi:ABC-type glycerol-3-phosphate transport system substrate-binding protein|nr:hypothetical protein [Stellaceae bacterium]
MSAGRHDRRRARALLGLALALALGGCAAAATSGSSTPGGYNVTDPYHYRCTGNCQAGA